MITKFNLLLICCLFLVSCQKEPVIDFFQEEINIEVKNSKVRVTGIYFFRNLTDSGKRVRFFYPFPADSNHLLPDTISLPFPYEQASNGIFFTMSFAAKSCDSFKIVYEQEVKYNYFVYITTTTEKWSRPIEQAMFTVIIPDSLFARINYPVFNDEKVNNNHYYYIKKKMFSPEEDLKIEWCVIPLTN